MMMRSGLAMLLAGLLLLPGVLLAADSGLSLSISSEGPWIAYWQPKADAGRTKNDEAVAPFFHVVLTSEAAAPVEIEATRSQWWEALSFAITTDDGRKFVVSRPAHNRLGNPTEAWLIGKGHCRVWVVNFHTGDWKGLPSTSELPAGKPMKLQAFFRIAIGGHEWTAQSEPVEMRP